MHLKIPKFAILSVALLTLASVARAQTYNMNPGNTTLGVDLPNGTCDVKASDGTPLFSGTMGTPVGGAVPFNGVAFGVPVTLWCVESAPGFAKWYLTTSTGIVSEGTLTPI